MGFTSSCCGLSMRPMSTRSIHVCPCGNEFSDAYLAMTQPQPSQTTPAHTSPQPPKDKFSPFIFTWQPPDDPDTIQPVKKEKVDDAEERLRAKVIPAFKGEAMCDFSAENEVLRGAPREPWFGADNARTQQSMAVIKRWTATNLRSWPVGRFDRQPAKLAFYPRSETGGDGEYIRAVFECGCCR